jgi:hypothetical protein
LFRAASAAVNEAVIKPMTDSGGSSALIGHQLS